MSVVAAMMVAVKTCKNCGVAKDVSEFYPARATRDRLWPHCKACASVLSRERRNSGLEAARARPRELYALNHADRLAKARARLEARRSADEEAVLAAARDRQRRWREAHPEHRDAAAEAAHNRRVREFATRTEPFTRKEIYERAEGVCHLCGLSVAWDEYDLDHIRPLSRGGTHTKDNVAVSHARCNRRKWSKWQ